MKKYICILASAALFTACEQKTETVNPAAPAPANKTEHNTTIVNPPPAAAKTESTTIIKTPPTPGTTTTTTTTSTPNP